MSWDVRGAYCSVLQRVQGAWVVLTGPLAVSATDFGLRQEKESVVLALFVQDALCYHPACDVAVTNGLTSPSASLQTSSLEHPT